MKFSRLRTQADFNLCNLDTKTILVESKLAQENCIKMTDNDKYAIRGLRLHRIHLS